MMIKLVKHCSLLNSPLGEVSLILKVTSTIVVANLPAVKNDSHSPSSIVFGKEVNSFLASSIFSSSFMPLATQKLI